MFTNKKLGFTVNLHFINFNLKLTMAKEELMTLEEIQKQLQDKRLYVVARATKLSYPTIKKLADGKPENYTYNTISKVSKYLKPTK